MAARRMKTLRLRYQLFCWITSSAATASGRAQT